MIGTIIDIETTGLLQFQTNLKGESELSDESEIIEVGFINIDMVTRKILTHGTLYFYKPYFDIESKAQRIHGLTRDFLRQHEGDFSKNLIILNSIIQCGCIIGKNSDKFDIPYIKAFIKKHAGDIFDIKSLVTRCAMKGYNGGTVMYNDTLYALDLQTIYKQRFHDLYEEKYGLKLGNNVIFEEKINKLKSVNPDLVTPENYERCKKLHEQLCEERRTEYVYLDPRNPALEKTKRGTLMQYVDVIPSGMEALEFVFKGLNKQREGGAHTALYDCAATFIVWCDATNQKLY